MGAVLGVGVLPLEALQEGDAVLLAPAVRLKQGVGEGEAVGESSADTACVEVGIFETVVGMGVPEGTLKLSFGVKVGEVCALGLEVGVLAPTVRVGGWV